MAKKSRLATKKKPKTSKATSTKKIATKPFLTKMSGPVAVAAAQIEVAEACFAERNKKLPPKRRAVRETLKTALMAMAADVEAQRSRWEEKFGQPFPSTRDEIERAALRAGAREMGIDVTKITHVEALRLIEDASIDRKRKADDERRWSSEKPPGEWCTIIDKSPTTLKRYVDDGTLVVKKITRRRWRIRLDTLKKLIGEPAFSGHFPGELTAN